MSSTYVQANTLGNLHDAREAVISPLDRGFLYGDAIYEVWRTYGGKLFATDEHWRRLSGSANGLSLELPFDLARMLEEIEKTTSAYREHTGWGGEIYIRLQITRGGGVIGLDTALADAPLWTIMVKSLTDMPLEDLERGMTAELARKTFRNDKRTMPPFLKTGNYLNNILALKEAKDAGAEEAIMCNLQGEVTEASVRNVWFVAKDEIVTPPLDSGLLAGVTRGFLLGWFPEFEGRSVREKVIRPADFASFEEVFFTSTTQDIVPVSRIGKRCFKTGADTVTMRFKRAFRERVLSTASRAKRD